jgi:hypothetical protein
MKWHFTFFLLMTDLFGGAIGHSFNCRRIEKLMNGRSPRRNQGKDFDATIE